MSNTGRSSEPSPGQRLSDDDFSLVVRLTPLVSIDLIIRDQAGRVLLGRRTNDPAKDSLFVPGGRITKNETIPAAFTRLTKEELGTELRFADAQLVGVFSHIYKANRFGDPSFGTHYVVLAYEATSDLPTEPLPRTQHREYVLKTEEEIAGSSEVHEFTKAYFIGGRMRSENQYNTLSFRRDSLNAMMWQTPALSLTAQAFLLNVSSNRNSFPEVRIVTCLLAFCIAVGTLQLFARHRRLEEASAKSLEAFERKHRHRGYEVLNARPQSEGVRGEKPQTFFVLTQSITEWLHRFPSFDVWSALLMLFAGGALCLLCVNTLTWPSSRDPLRGPPTVLPPGPSSNLNQSISTNR
jgi:colanic acid biosynthesis protein WcaH